MNYDNAFIEKVKSFGMLKYPPHKMAFLLQPENREQFLLDIEDTESELYKAYQQGMMTGQYTSDKALFDASKNNDSDANNKLNDRQQKERVDTAIYERFGL